MADKLSQLKDAFEEASLKAQNAYDAFNGYGTGGKYGAFPASSSLKQAYLTAVDKDDKKDIAKFEGLYQKALAEYNKAQEEKNKARLALNRYEKAQEKKSVAKETANQAFKDYQKAIADLRVAGTELVGPKGAEKYNTAYKNAVDAYDKATKAGLTVPPLENPKVEITYETQDGKANGGGQEEPPKTDTVILQDYFSTDAKRKELQTQLQKFGYKGPVDGKYSSQLYNFVQNLVTQRGTAPESLRGKDLQDFLVNADKIGWSLGASGKASGAGAATSQTQISDPTQAASIIQPVFDKVLGREATAKEVAALTSILNDAEKKNPYKTINGVTTGGIDRTQFLIDLIKTGTYAANKKAYPGTLAALAQEASKVKGEAEALKAGKEEGVAFDNRTRLMSTAKANGLTLSETQIENYLKQIKAGKDIGILEQDIRNMAGLGMPDSIKKHLSEGTDLETIYSPYRQRMASILEIPYDQIGLEDSALRSAIGPDKEMPLYEFEKALRKDNRWQYTDNARQTVSDAALRVLRDFGFQG